MMLPHTMGMIAHHANHTSFCVLCEIESFGYLTSYKTKTIQSKSKG
jgi:hypothetical protein